MNSDDPTAERVDEDASARVLACDAILHITSTGAVSAPSDVDSLRGRGHDRLRLLLRLLEATEGDADRASVADRGSPGEGQDGDRPLLGRFEVLEHLGAGGFGFVVRARDRLLGREVALKMPLPERMLGSGDVDRFLREARSAARLDHPNIVRVFDAGEIGPLGYFIASEYCAGQNLRHCLNHQDQPIAPRLAARWVAALAGAVQHAHERGILHRDVKPENIMMAGGPDPGTLIPRLSDFGLAKLVEEAGGQTRSEARLGTPQYMAPEQASGRRERVGPATDVYALGATLYEVMVGRPPLFGDSDAETLRLVIESEPPAPRTLRPGLPRDLETICWKCLEKDPARRYPSAGALRDDLERFLRGEPILARPVSSRARAIKWVRRRPMHAAALALAILGASVSIGGIVYRDVLLQHHARELEREVSRADANARLARRHLRAFQLRQAREVLDAGQVERAQDILATLQADPYRSDGRHDPVALGFAWHYLTRLAHRDLVVLSDRQAERVNTMALSPDGGTLATGDEDGTIRLRDPETGRVRAALPGHQLAVDLLAFAPDGSRLVSRGGGGRPSARKEEVLVWDLAAPGLHSRLDGLVGRLVDDLHFGVGGRYLLEVSSTEPGRRELGSWDVATDPAHPHLFWRRPTGLVTVPVSGDGRIVAIDEPGRRFVVQDLATGKEMGRIGPIDHEHDFAALSPDGRLLALGRSPSSPTISVWDVATGHKKTQFDDPWTLFSFGFSPDGRYLVTRHAHGLMKLRDLATGAVTLLTSPAPEAYPPTDYAFSADGQFLTTNVSPLGSSQSATIWQLDPWRQVATYPGVRGGWGLFTRDARSLILNVNEAAIRWNYATPPEKGQPDGHADEAWSLAFSPDGSILASGSDDDEPETIKLWDVATGRRIRGWSAGRGTVAALAFDPLGQVLASAHLDPSGEVRLWDPASGRCLASLAGHTGFVRSVAFSPDGKTLTSAGSDRTIRLWDVTSYRLGRVLEGHANVIRQVAFSPDGTRLASASNDFNVRIWDVARGLCIRTLRTIDKVAAVAFAPDGRSLAAADEKGTISVWDVESGARLQSLPVEHDFPLCLGYSPDGHSLAVAGKARTIRIWDPLTSQELLTLNGHKAQVNGLAFSPDGSVLASCSHDGIVRLWRSAP